MHCPVGANEAGATLTLVSPTSGGTGGGSLVTLTGTGFSGTTTVTFGSGSGAVTVPATIISPTMIHVTAPAHGVGVVDISVSTNGTSAMLAGVYTYGIVNATPAPRVPAPTSVGGQAPATAAPTKVAAPTGTPLTPTPLPQPVAH